MVLTELPIYVEDQNNKVSNPQYCDYRDVTVRRKLTEDAPVHQLKYKLRKI